MGHDDQYSYMTMGHFSEKVKAKMDTCPPVGGKVLSPGKSRVPRCGPGYSQQWAWLRGYSFKEAGSERFLGDFLFSVAISCCPEAGTATLPFRTMSSASIFLP